MDYDYKIEEIFDDEIREEKTGAKTVGPFFSGLSLIGLIKKAEEKLLSSNFTKSIKKGYTSLVSSFKKSKLARNIAIYGLVGAMMTFGVGCRMNNQNENGGNNTTSITQENNKEPLIPETSLFNVLLNASKSIKQKTVLSSVGNFLADFNIRFANPIADDVTIIDETTGEERTITVKPALTWDEAMAMTLVYNNFSKNELIQILNGAEIDAYKLNNSYKMAILQLMGAHVLETREHPVKTEMLLQSKEAQEFYEKYHQMFLKCKETTGEQRLLAVRKFYDEVYKDFPISSEVREKGIAHSDSRATIEPYKFSIIPMISAAEIMFQNIEIDHTLSQQAIDYLNDIGACNIAEDILTKAEYVSLSTSNNEDYADYDSVKAALIAFLSEKYAYVIDDEHRDLSLLPAFIEAVNGFILEPYTYTVVTTYTTTETYTVTEKFETDDRDKAVEAAGEDAVAEAERKAQEKLDRENQEAKDKAEKEADQIADDMQKEEDKKKDDLQNKVDNDNQNLQDNIDNANNNINNGGTVNEGDIGHGTDFDNNHSDSNGNLNDSIKDITTDGSGAVDSLTPLPDPNVEQGYAYSYNTEPVFDNLPMEEQSSNVYEYEEPYVFSSADEVNAYIEYQAAHPITENEKAVQYHL